MTMSKDEEIEYWRRQCEEKTRKIQELEEGFDEFQQSSKELEVAMEQELHLAEERAADLQRQLERFKQSSDDLLQKSRAKAQEMTNLSLKHQEELDRLKEEKSRLLREQRNLEQKNDDLERRSREHDATINDLTEKLDKLYEENVWLKTELEINKQNSEEVIQRLKDELRDQKLEITLLRTASFREQVVKDRKPTSLAIINDMLSIVKGLEKRLCTHSNGSQVISSFKT